MTTRIRALALASLAVMFAVAVPASQTPTFTRTQLQDQDLAIKSHHGVMARSEFPPGASSGRHFHPGEEFAYMLEGALELTEDGKPPRVYKAGEVIFIPAGVIHNARNVGTGPAKALATYFLEKGKPLATPVK